MLTTTEKTVREIAVEDPSSLRVFESLGIDYCCGGNRSLSEACGRAGVSPEQVEELLHEARRRQETTPSDRWEEKPLGELIHHIVDAHHALVRSETPRLQGLAHRVASKHGEAHPEVAEIERLFGEIAEELASHMMKEERILFPYIAAFEEAQLRGAARPGACFGSVRQPIANMIHEHDSAGALLSQIRSLSHRYAPPEDACMSFVALYRGLEEFEQDLHRHIHLENNILFPRAVELEASQRA